ncbi:MAG: hypothetical protein HY914_04165 [Desulfomonile tiedjei]|nr:hypothetical protein [Desulfomonile tiedjei]
MTKPPRETGPRAIILVEGLEGESRLIETLWKRGISAQVMAEPAKALDECRANPPHLAIVASELGAMAGTRFLAELLKVSWTTSTILIADEDEEAVHLRTEGLGILGSIRTAEDTASLERLLETFLEIV